MKYLSILPLILTSCCMPKPVTDYQCTFFNMHGTYGNATVPARSLDEAIQIAETFRDKLVREQVLPECGVHCELKGTQ